ncbi:hypothetical protein [Vibrio vulnificus]|uniref:Uncharacterized protein n=1 Tax=Vibrio vulnificus TaxID=672 RepID=A0AAN1PWB2_VIBVL|nr:hypothetical protein [Vibrio vulnificus]AXX63928.1 hypothetical protein FORC53_5589 [Vibrio vulnificus]
MKYITLALIGSVLSTPALAIQPDPTKWTIVKDVDEFTDKVSYSGTIQLINEVQPASMFCNDGEVFIGFTGGAYNYKGKFYTSKIRVDKNSPLDVSLMGGSNSKVHYLTDNSEWLNEFKSGNSVIIETKGIDNESKIVRFNLKNFTKTFNEVSLNCK